MEPYGIIDRVEFSIAGDEEVKSQSVVNITHGEKMAGHQVVNSGVYDLRMGALDYGTTCLTCKLRKKDCIGHFGSSQLNVPVINPLYTQLLQTWISIICHNCGDLIAGEIKNFKVLNTVSETLAEYKYKAAKMVVCTHCFTKVHKLKYNKKTRQFEKNKKTVTINMIRKIVDNVQDRVLEYLGMTKINHPRKLVLSTIPVPPMIIRPKSSTMNDNRVQNHGSTVFLSNILTKNKQTNPAELNNVDYSKDVSTDISERYSEYISGVTGKDTTKVAVMDALKGGKDSLLRGKAVGKTTVRIGRSVITGDSSLRVDQAGVPIDILRVIFAKDVVNAHNIELMNMMFKNGPKVYPGAKYICIGGIEKDKSLVELINEKYVLKYGDIIYRNTYYGDWVAINRQPSLLDSSIASYKVVPKKGRTISFNPVNCIHFNADFDGDDMNCIIPTSTMSRVELEFISNSKSFIISGQTNRCQMGVIQDELVAGNIFSRIETKISKYKLMRWASTGSNYFKFTENETAQTAFGKLIPAITHKNNTKYFDSSIADYVTYTENDKKPFEIINGKVISGVLDSNSIGQGKDNSIFKTINSIYGSRVCLDATFNVQQFMRNYSMALGFSMNIGDFTVDESAKNIIRNGRAKTIRDGTKINDLLDSGSLKIPLSMAEYSFAEYYEMAQLAALSTSDDIYIPSVSAIDLDNMLLTYILSGTKGKKTNFISLLGAYGQSTINNERHPSMYNKRTHPFYGRFDISPEAHGYIPGTYSEGIPIENFVFAAADARVDIIRTALQTPDAGAFSRRMLRQLEGCITNNKQQLEKYGRVIQYAYGGHGFNLKSLLDVNIDISNPKAVLSPKIKKLHGKSLAAFLMEETRSQTESTDWIKDWIKYLYEINIKYKWNKKVRSPVDIESMLLSFTSQSTDTVSKVSDPVKNRKLVVKYLNSIKSKICSITIHYINISLSLAKLAQANINADSVKLLIDSIDETLFSSLIDGGSNIGYTTAQSISEPVTQNILNSKHKEASAANITSISLGDKFNDVFSSRSPTLMKMPNMFLIPREEYKYDRQSVQRLSTQIEFQSVNDILSYSSVLFNNSNKWEFSNEEDTDIFKNFNSEVMPLSKSNYKNTIIKLVFDQRKCIVRDIKTMKIISTLYSRFRNVMIVSTSIYNELFVAYILFESSSSLNINYDYVNSKIKDIKRSTIKGERGITRSDVLSRNDEHGREYYYVQTVGINTKLLWEHPKIDPYLSYNNSTFETFFLQGIIKTKAMTIAEILSAMESGFNSEHGMLIVDEFTKDGSPKQHSPASMIAREPTNVYNAALLHDSKNSFVKSAINNVSAGMDSFSGQLINGTSYGYGTTYNNIKIDFKKLMTSTIAATSILDEDDSDDDFMMGNDDERKTPMKKTGGGKE